MSLEETIKGAMSEAGMVEDTSGAEDSGGEVDDLTPEADNTDNDVDIATDESVDAAGEPEAKAAKPLAAEKVEEPKKEEPKPLADDDLGPEKDKHGRENRLPHSRVKVMVSKAEERGYTKAKTEYEPKLQEVTTRTKQYEDRLEAISNVETIMFDHPDKFIEILPTLNPRYAEILMAAKKAQQEEAPVLDGTPEALEKRLAWEREQAKRDALKELDPIVKEHQAAKRNEVLRPQMEAKLQDAVDQWPGFADNADAILKVMQDDRINASRTRGRMKHTLETAYAQVLLGKIKESQESAKVDRDKLEQEIRAKVIAELKAAPAATNLVAGKSKPVTDTAPKSREDLIKQAMRKAGIK
jgi:hypothetical protein